MKLVVELQGGPPWGLRAAKRNSDEAVFVSQVITGGKATLAGIKIGDVLESVQGLSRRPTFEEVQQVLAEANCIHLQLSRVHFEEEEDHNNDPVQMPFIDQCEETKITALNNQIAAVQKVEKNNMSKSMNHPNPTFPTSIFPGVQAQLAAENGEFRNNHPYSGGFCGTARDKRRFFELAAAQQIEKPPPPLHRHKELLNSQTISTSQISMASDQAVHQQQQQSEHQLGLVEATAPQLTDFVNSFALDRAFKSVIRDIVVQVPESQAVSRHIFMARKPTAFQPVEQPKEEPVLSMAELCAKIGSQLVLKPKGMAAGGKTIKTGSTIPPDNNNKYKTKLGRVLDDPVEVEDKPLTIANNTFKFRSTTNCNENFCYQYPTTDDESTIQPTKSQLFNVRKESSELSTDTGFGSWDSDTRGSLQGGKELLICGDTGHPNLPDNHTPDLITLPQNSVPHPAATNVQPASPKQTPSNQLVGDQADCASVNTFVSSQPDYVTQPAKQQEVFGEESKEVGDLKDLAQTLQILTENVGEKKPASLKMLVNQSSNLQPPLKVAAALTPEQNSSTLSSSSSSPLNGDASASSTSSSMLVAGVSVKLGTIGLEKNCEDRLHLASEPGERVEKMADPAATGAASSNKSLWYRQMYKQLHCLEEQEKGQYKSVPKFHQQKEQPKMYGRKYQRPTTPTWRLESSQRSAASNYIEGSGVRRSKSQPRQPYRYDPVADMEILDRWKWQQKLQQSTSSHSLNGKPRVAYLDEDYNGGSERSTASIRPNGLNSTKDEGSVSSTLPCKDNLLQKQKIEKLCEELENQLARKHGYLPSSTPSLQNNLDRFDHLMYSFVGGRGSRSRSATPLSRSNSSSRPVQTCTLLYTFVGEGPRELSLNKGDVVRLHKQLDENWWEGERNGQVGIFPASYAHLDENTNKDRLKALYAFKARNTNELNFNKGDTLQYLRTIDQHWLEGRNAKGQVGIFPRSYVQEVDGADKHFRSTISFAEDCLNGIPDRPKTPKVGNGIRVESPFRTAKSVPTASEAPVWQLPQPLSGAKAAPPTAPLAASSAPALFVPKNAETYRALYPYKPEHSDELALVEDDIVFVVEKCDDGWFIGKLLRTGQFGTFPGNYVVKH